MNNKMKYNITLISAHIYIYIWTIPAKGQPVQKNSFLQLFQSEINLDEKF